MIWDTHTFGIVMLTRNEEGGRVNLMIIPVHPLITNVTLFNSLNATSIGQRISILMFTAPSLLPM